MSKKNHFINAYRTKEERKVRYCFLRQIGLNRSLTRSIVGRSDNNIIKSIENLEIYKNVNT